MSAILKFDFQKRKQLHFSEENYLNYTKKDQILHVTMTFFPKTKGNKDRQWTHLWPLKYEILCNTCTQGAVIWRVYPN